MFGFFTKKQENKEMKEIIEHLVVYGRYGTEGYMGQWNDDYTSVLNHRDKVIIYDKMRRSDATISALIEAYRLPILQAKPIIQCEDEKIKEFVEQNLFKNIKFKKFLKEALLAPVFGFYYFEKVFKKENGRIEWASFEPRNPLAHYRFMPDYIEQIVTGDESINDNPNLIRSKEGNNYLVKTPVSKCIVFTHNEEAGNKEGLSLLRPCYRYWNDKQKILDLIFIHAEKYAVPNVTGKTEGGADYKKQLADMLQNFTSGKNNYIITGKSDEISEIGGKNMNIVEYLDGHINLLNREISKNFLAMFMVNGDNGTGTQAKTVADLDFFMMSLKAIVDNFSETMSDHINELVALNFSTAEEVKLTFTDLDSTDVDKFVNMIASLTDKGYLSAEDEKLQEYVRANLDLPEMDDKQKKEVKEKDDDQKKKMKLQAKNKEAEFVSVITEFERLLAKAYDGRFKPLSDKIEARLIKTIKTGYNNMNTEYVNGVEKIKSSGVNNRKKNDLIKEVEAIFDEFQAKLESDYYMKHVFNLATKAGKKAIKLKGESGNRYGYLSNVLGYIFQTRRHIVEKIVDNVSAGAILAEVLKQVDEIKGNENNYKLSVLAHSRAEFRKIVMEEAEAQGINMYKAVISSDYPISQLSQYGLTAQNLYRIKSRMDWDKVNGSGNVNVVGGLGIHHNDPLYYLPLFYSEEEEQKSQEQIKDLYAELELYLN